MSHTYIVLLGLTLAACGGSLAPFPQDGGSAPTYCYTGGAYLLLCAPNAHTGDSCATPYGNGTCEDGPDQ